ncbi:hypothetical protein [Candidatus Palauibacter sp.]|uniref:hypothetical protein n=1 Tax=Candidatus Palauibacter sp. TaxID=3101350 RepID=UPI003CC6CC71
MSERTRRSASIAMTMAVMAMAACASSGRLGTYTRLVITGGEIREAGYGTAYEALTHHRELIIFEDQIGFRGGNDGVGVFGRATQEFYVPLLVVDGDFNLNDEITTLRRIRADDIVMIRLYRQSMVPPRYRRPGAEGGVIEVSTRPGSERNST